MVKASCNSTLSLLIQFLFALNFGREVACFSLLSSQPAVAPNFESFVESVSGEWKASSIQQSKHAPTCWKGPCDTWMVEEVMRPCGGAIQGITESFMDTSAKEVLFNPRRNDDGFIFFDSGSFSFGPDKLVDLDSSSSTFEYSFVTAEDKRLRLKISKDQEIIVSAQVRTSGNEDLESSLTPISETITNQLSYGSWEGEVCVCSSYTPSSWINTRLKWTCEEYFCSDGDSGGLLKLGAMKKHLCNQEDTLVQPCQGVWISHSTSRQNLEVFAGYFDEKKNYLEAFLRIYDVNTGLLKEVQRFNFKECS